MYLTVGRELSFGFLTTGKNNFAFTVRPKPISSPEKQVVSVACAAI